MLPENIYSKGRNRYNNSVIRAQLYTLAVWLAETLMLWPLINVAWFLFQALECEMVCGHQVEQVDFLQVFQLLPTVKSTEMPRSVPK